MNKKIKISIVNYTNTLPFRWALENSDLISGIELQKDIPSICAQKLKFGQVDLALVPVALLPELTSFNIESEYCIGTEGAVESVKLYSNVPLPEIKSITLDYQSRSSILLTQILSKFYWMISPVYLDAKPGFEKSLDNGNANVVIGDRTFELNGSFKYEYDLGEEWNKFTGLPFVFAVWVSSKKLNNDFIALFNQTLKHGVDNSKQAVEESLNELSLSKEKAIQYLTEKISYKLDEKKLKGMNLFLEYITRL